MPAVGFLVSGVCMCVHMRARVCGDTCMRESTSDFSCHHREAEQVSLQARRSPQATLSSPVQAHPVTNCCDSEGGGWTGAESGAQVYGCWGLPIASPGQFL